MRTEDQQAPKAGALHPRVRRPDRIGKYHIVEELGHGAMGVVYRAHDPDLDRLVAIKRIAPSHGGDDTLVERFRREARLAASLSHPNIVTVYDFGEERGTLFMVMELLEGEDLAQALARRRLESLEDRLAVLEQISAGAAVAHARGLVHRDLKPANVHLGGDGGVKILDFGLARSREPFITQAGDLLGTPQYMAPEQVRGERADARSDVFALGAIFYEVLTGRRCFPANNIHAAIFQVLERQPEPIRQYDPSLPTLLDLVVRKALAKDPLHRFRDGGELAEAVTWQRRVLNQESSESQAIQALAFRTDSLVESGASLSGVATGTSAGSAPVASGQKPGTARLTFLGEKEGDRVLELEDLNGKSLLEHSLAASIPHFHECGGRARCSTCRVRVVAHPESLPPRNRLEERMAERLGWGDDIRLACQTQIQGDVVVQRLIRDSEDFGLLRFEGRQEAPEETTVALLACRVLNFQEVAVKSAPYDVVHVLNRFFLQVGEPVVSTGGTVERYLGEGLLAHYRGEGKAREKCLSAIRAALRMRVRMADLNRYLESHFGSSLRVAVGLHFGRAIVGHVGHPSHMRPTTIGPLPETVSQLTTLARGGSSPILATEAFFNLVDEDVETGEIFQETLPNLGEAQIYELIDLTRPDAVWVAQSSFESVARRSREAADLLYRLLFEIDPSIRSLFEGVEMDTQGEMLMEMLGKAVAGLDDLETLRPVVQELGRRHAAYGVELRHYDAVEQALMETFRQLLGEHFTTDVRLAWSGVYNELARMMIEASP